MTISPGARLGPYEVLGQIGAGGMGEVYRAKDSRLGRDVAIKVLPASFSQDADRLRRFEQEARAAGVLNHPNITAVYDIGTHEDSPYVVQELLEGETLRTALSAGRMAQRKAIDYALQIAHGLAAAHEKGIVHRDLKPENLFVTKDGRVKILDFGLAKLTSNEARPDATSLPTAAGATEPGVVLGTLGYMSPEQVKGKPADARSDIFSFGAILYEMLAGRRAFHGDSAAETMAAILREEPPDISVTNQQVSPGLDRIVRHSIEKSPQQRFHSAHDVAFALEALSGLSTAATPAAAAVKAGRSRWLGLAAAGVLVAAAIAAAAYAAGRRTPAGSRTNVSFTQLTFRQAPIFNARFAPDGKTVVYSAALSGNMPEILSLRPDYPESTPRGLRDVHLLSVSSRGELAVLTRARFLGHSLFLGTLARMPLEGGAPREILAGVREADWSPDGAELAVIREVNGKDRLEFPAGKVLAETGGYFSNPRFSPKGDRIAIFEHPLKYDDRGLVAVVELAGKKTVLSDGYWGEEGLAWSAGGDEVLFSAGAAYNAFKIYGVTLSGRRRTALESAGGLTIQDVGKDGRWITSRDDHSNAVLVLGPGQASERDLSWLDLSDAQSLTPDGKALLFSDYSGRAGGANYSTCLRQTDGSPVVRLGDGSAGDISRDGNDALAIVPTSPAQLVVYPTGAGEPRRLERGGLVSYETARFFPDGRRVLACGHEEGRAVRCYVQEIGGGAPRALTPEGTTQGFPSPDGRSVLVSGSDGLRLCPVEGGEPRSIPGTGPDDVAVRWSADGRSVLVRRGSSVPAAVERLDIATGARKAVLAVGPTDALGVLNIGTITVSDDEKSYAYTSRRMLSQLFLAEGAR